MPASLSSSVRRRFWDYISEGMSPSDAGVAVGVSMRTGWGWFADAAGVRPCPSGAGSYGQHNPQTTRGQSPAGTAHT